MDPETTSSNCPSGDPLYQDGTPFYSVETNSIANDAAHPAAAASSNLTSGDDVSSSTQGGTATTLLPEEHSQDGWHTLPPPDRTVFPDEQEARSYTNQWARAHGYAVTIRRRKNDRNKMNETVYLKCERGGKYGERYAKFEEHQRKRRNTGTRLCDCPFRIVLRQRKDCWLIDPQELSHNHEPSDAVAQPANRRQDMKKVAHLIEMHMAAGLTPAQSLASIQREYNYSLAITPRDMWNERNNIRRHRRTASLSADTTTAGMDEHFLLFKDEIEEQPPTRIAFIHKQTLERLLSHYPEILCIDSVGKADPPMLSMVNLIAVTAEDDSFIIGSALMTLDAASYTWLFKCISKIYQQFPNHSPKVIITGPEGEVQAGIEEAMPEGRHMLCFRTAEQEIRAYARFYLYRQAARKAEHLHDYQSDDEEFVDDLSRTGLEYLLPDIATEVNKLCSDFGDAVMGVLRAATEESYRQAWDNVKRTYSFAPDLLTYVRRKWLSCKERLVTAWTDQYRNYNVKSIPHIEGYHRILKRYLPQQNISWSDITDQVLPYFQKRLQELVGRIETERSMTRTEWRGELFRQCRSLVSSYALNEVKKRIDMFNLVPTDSPSLDPESSGKLSAVPGVHIRELLPCTGHYTSITGLPCEHIIQQRLLLQSSLTPSDFDQHWHLTTKRVHIDYSVFLGDGQQGAVSQSLQSEAKHEREKPSDMQQHQQQQQQQQPVLAPETDRQLTPGEHQVASAFNAMTASLAAPNINPNQSLQGQQILSMEHSPMTPAVSYPIFRTTNPSYGASAGRGSSAPQVEDSSMPQTRGHTNAGNNFFTVCPIM